jgi:hypothetical protein
MTKFEDRFARQNPFEPPSRFLVTSPYSVIVHHLSGLSRYTLTRILQPLVYKNWSILIILFTFIAQTEHFLLCLLFVYILNSLARVSRRDNKLYFIKAKTEEKKKQTLCFSFSFLDLFFLYYNLLLPF